MEQSSLTFRLTVSTKTYSQQCDVSNSSIVHEWSVKPAAIAGVRSCAFVVSVALIFKAELIRQKLKCATNRAIESFRFSSLFENPKQSLA